MPANAYALQVHCSIIVGKLDCQAIQCIAPKRTVDEVVVRRKSLPSLSRNMSFGTLDSGRKFLSALSDGTRYAYDRVLKSLDFPFRDTSLW